MMKNLLQNHFYKLLIGFLLFASTIVQAQNGLHFDGTSDYVEIPTSTSLNSYTTTGELTIEYWIKPVFPATGNVSDLISKRPTTNDAGFAIQLAATGAATHYINTSAGWKSVVVNYTNNTWQHIAVTVKAGGSINVYINGTLSGTTSLSGMTLTTSTSVVRLMSSTLIVGNYGQGILDEVRFWKAERTLTQIQSYKDCQLAGTETGLVAYYKFNQGTASGTNTGVTTLTDATTNANTGTLLGTFALTGSTSNWVTGTSAGALVTPSVSIVASSTGTVSYGTNITFTATPTNGGGSPQYQWKKNGTNVGTNSATYADATLVNNDVITCVLTSNANCLTTATATSNSVTMSVIYTIRYVKTAASGTGDGTSWANASADLQAMINIANVQQVWVAAGTYVPGASRSSFFQLKNDVDIYGGFPATGIPVFADRNVTTYSTILSGQISGNRVYHVLYGTNGVTNATLIDGITISDGSSNGAGGDNHGGGILLDADGSGVVCSPVFQNCTITNNFGITGGGGYIRGTNGAICNPTFTNCTFSNNQGSYAAGIWVNGLTGTCLPSFTNCNFTNNAASANPGVVYFDKGAGQFTGCTFSGNTASNGPAALSFSVCTNPCVVSNCTFTGNTTSGGGSSMSIYQCTNAQVSNCTFTSNTSGAGGIVVQECNPTITGCTFNSNTAVYASVIQNIAASPKIVNCLFYGNSATNSGGVMYNDGTGSSPTLVNCTFYNNTAPNGGAFYNGTGGNLVLKNCAFYGNGGANTFVNSGGSTTATNSLFDNSVTGYGNSATNYTISSSPFINAASNNFQLTECSKGINHGSNSDYTAASSASTDLAGNTRVQNTTIDIGAYESSLNVTYYTPSVSIAASPSGTITSGTSVIFTATPTNGGTSPTYQWKKNGTNVGTNSATYTNTGLVNGDVITCVLTPSTEICTTTPTATSSGITMSVTLVGAALDFDGADDYVACGNLISNMGQLTVQAWVKPTTNTDYTPIITQEGVFEMAMINGGVIYIVVGTSQYCTTTDYPFETANLGVWKHLTVVFDGTAADNSSRLKLYIDGVLQTLNFAGTVPTTTGTTANILKLGSYNTYPTRFTGTMDEVRFWSRALSQCEIQNNMNCELGSAQIGLLAYHKFNQSSGTTLADASGNSNTGTLTSFALTGTTSNWVYPGAVTTGTTCTVLPTPSVSIVANPSGTIIAGTSVTFTATYTNGGTSPTYQWKNGSTVVGINSATYISPSLANGDVITCVLTPSAEICTAPPTATSSGITMSVTEPIRYVKTAASGTGDGTSWTNASADLQAMINVTGVQQVWVASGTYKTNSSDRASYFQLANNVAVYGGFTGTETLLSQRNVTTNPTIISGDIGTSSVNTDNNYHLFVIDAKTNTRLDGFTFRDGYNEYGDGAFRILNNSDIDIANCTFTTNHGYNYGHLRGISSTVRLTNCNITVGHEENIINQDGTFTVTNCTFFNMKRGFLNDGTGSSTFTNCLFYGINAPNSSGGGIRQNSTGNMTLTNCTFTNNKSYFNPAINIDAGKSVTAVNCIFWDNDDGSGIGGEGTLTITYSIVQGGYTGTGNINDNPLFTNTASNDFTLQHCSAAINNGNNAAVSGILTDLAGNTRTQQTTVDMGVYESNYSVSPCSYTWTGRTSTDWSTASNWTPNNIPTSIDDVTIPTTSNKPMLPANQTIANLTLTGTNKIMLGSSNLCVNSITGGTASSFIVTDGTGGLIIKALSPSVSTSFPIGASETSYDPLSIQPTNSVDFTVKVKATANETGFSGTIANFAKVVPRQWDVTPTGTAGSTLLAVLPSVSYVPTTPKMGHYTGTAWEELSAQYFAGPNAWAATTTTFSPFGVGDAGGFVAVLSVEWLSFTGYHNDGVNVLNWQTANEVSNKGFYIERLNSTTQNWEILGFKAANNKTSTYDFTDNAPLSTSYYRLRQLDNDGKETLSKVISVSSKGSDKLKVYPNPVSNVLTIERNAVPFTTNDFEILNLLGQQVLSGKAAQRIDVSALPQGTYFLKIGAEQVKFIKY